MSCSIYAKNLDHLGQLRGVTEQHTPILKNNNG